MTQQTTPIVAKQAYMKPTLTKGQKLAEITAQVSSGNRGQQIP